MKNKTPTLLFVSPFPEDHESLRTALECSRWRLESARTCPEAWIALHRRPVNAVITDHLFPDSLSWRDLVDEVGSVLDAPVIVAAPRSAAGRIVEEVLAEGGFDVLRKPFSRAELLGTLSAAWRLAEDRRVLAHRLDRQGERRVTGQRLLGAQP